jgi:hypothetical protein
MQRVWGPTVHTPRRRDAHDGVSWRHGGCCARRVSLRAFALLPGVALLGFGCHPCADPAYVHRASGSSEYLLTGRTADGQHLERRGLGPSDFSMLGYSPFSCQVEDASVFELELAPACRLRLRPGARTTMRRDWGGALIQSESRVLRSTPCELDLDEGSFVHGTTDGGNLVIRPDSADLTFTLTVQRWNGEEVSGHRLRVTMTGAWRANASGPSAATLPRSSGRGSGC